MSKVVGGVDKVGEGGGVDKVGEGGWDKVG